MNEKKIEELVLKLIEKTNNKEAIWNTTSRDNEFILNFEKGGSITVDNWEQNGGHLIDLNIRSEKGLSIYSVVYEDSEDLEKYNFLKKLHQAARDFYFNVEDALDDIFKDVNSNKIIGKTDESDKLPW